jgi:hypothetical protein
MSKRMAKLYEKAWNKVVDNLAPWKKDIIVNHKDESPDWDKISSEVTKAAVRMAESWEWDIENKKVSK